MLEKLHVFFCNLFILKKVGKQNKKQAYLKKALDLC